MIYTKKRLQKELNKIQMSDSEIRNCIHHIGEGNRPLSPAEIFLLEKAVILGNDYLTHNVFLYSVSELAENFNVNVRYIEDVNMPKGVMAVIRPSTTCNAIIEVPYSQRNNPNYFSYEIAIYILYRDDNKRLTSTHERLRKEKASSYTYKRDFVARSLMCRRENIKEHIDKYDESHPKLDETKFISELCKKYNMTKDEVIKRIQDVRKIYLVEGYLERNR